MAEQIKLQEEELQQINQIQQVTQNIVLEYGNIELSRKALQARIDRADNALAALREQEQGVAKQLQDKYGVGSINLQEGTFIPAPVEQSTE